MAAAAHSTSAPSRQRIARRARAVSSRRSAGTTDGGEDLLHAIFRAAASPSKGRGAPGDDCARLAPPRGRALAWTVDQLALGVHARCGVAPERLAVKLLRRCLSDLAAAGAEPWAAVWTIAAPPTLRLPFLSRLARAFLREARAFGLPVVGGDVSRAEALVLTASLLGMAPRGGAPGRSGARAGDVLCVTGRLGGAVQSGRHLQPEPRLAEGRRLATRHRAHAMMDLSDGLARDLPRLLARSHAGAVIRLEDLPLSSGLPAGRRGWERALGDGEDYELLVALAPRAARAALRDPLLRRCGFTAIGEVRAGRTLHWTLHGARVAPRARGWEHAWDGGDS